METLKRASEILPERQQQYGNAAPMFDAVAQRWSLTLGSRITPAQIALCLIDLKIARLNYDPTHTDSVVDVAGYAALLAEVLEVKRGK